MYAKCRSNLTTNASYWKKYVIRSYFTIQFSNLPMKRFENFRSFNLSFLRCKVRCCVLDQILLALILVILIHILLCKILYYNILFINSRRGCKNWFIVSKGCQKRIRTVALEGHETEVQ